MRSCWNLLLVVLGLSLVQTGEEGGPGRRKLLHWDNLMSKSAPYNGPGEQLTWEREDPYEEKGTPWHDILGRATDPDMDQDMDQSMNRHVDFFKPNINTLHGAQGESRYPTPKGSLSSKLKFRGKKSWYTPNLRLISFLEKNYPRLLPTLGALGQPLYRFALAIVPLGLFFMGCVVSIALLSRVAVKVLTFLWGLVFGIMQFSWSFVLYLEDKRVVQSSTIFLCEWIFHGIAILGEAIGAVRAKACLLYTSPSPRD